MSRLNLGDRGGHIICLSVLTCSSNFLCKLTVTVWQNFKIVLYLNLHCKYIQWPFHWSENISVLIHSIKPRNMLPVTFKYLQSLCAFYSCFVWSCALISSDNKCRNIFISLTKKFLFIIMKKRLAWSNPYSLRVILSSHCFKVIPKSQKNVF